MKFKRHICKALEVSVESGHISCEIGLIKAQLRLRVFSSLVYSSALVTLLS